MSSSWVEGCWISKLSVVVLIIQSFLSGLGNFDEVGKVLSICEVLVKVVLEMLDEIHVVLHKVESSDSWERKGLIVKFPGMD